MGSVGKCWEALAVIILCYLFFPFTGSFRFQFFATSILSSKGLLHCHTNCCKGNSRRLHAGHHTPVLSGYSVQCGHINRQMLHFCNQNASFSGVGAHFRNVGLPTLIIPGFIFVHHKIQSRAFWFDDQLLLEGFKAADCVSNY